MKISAVQLSRELRYNDGGFVKNRRVTATLTAIGMASLTVVALYQLGVFKRLPEALLPGLDAERVSGSAEAYEMLGVPDAILGLGSYAATLGLTAMGGANRAQTQPWLPLALAVKVGADTLQAAILTRKSWVTFRAFSLYSLVVVITSILALPTVLPEARAGWRKLHGG